MKFSSVGTLRYAGKDSAKLYVDTGICEFYRAIIPKSRPIPQIPMVPCHITVVRLGIESSPNPEAWGKHQGEQVSFDYDNEIQFDGIYYFLRAWSPRLEEIRQELGLPLVREGFSEFHITIGNTKGHGSEKISVIRV